jgi:hypothetical protein
MPWTRRESRDLGKRQTHTPRRYHGYSHRMGVTIMSKCFECHNCAVLSDTCIVNVRSAPSGFIDGDDTTPDGCPFFSDRTDTHRDWRPAEPPSREPSTQIFQCTTCDSSCILDMSGGTTTPHHCIYATGTKVTEWTRVESMPAISPKPLTPRCLGCTTAISVEW